MKTTNETYAPTAIAYSMTAPLELNWNSRSASYFADIVLKIIQVFKFSLNTLKIML